MPAFTYASKAVPCPLCSGDHACSRTPDGLVFCRRRHGEEECGWVYLGEAQGGTWGMYRREEDCDRDRQPFNRPRERPSAGRPTKAGHPCASQSPSPLPRLAMFDWIAAQKQPLGGLPLALLATTLGLPTWVFATLPVEWLPNDTRNCSAYVFPEKDARGQITGYLLRYPDKKLAYGPRGLIIPDGWRDRPGPLFSPEGASDTLTLTALGFAAIGRFNASGGASLLADFLHSVTPARRVILLADNDAAGITGAVSVAARLNERNQP